jgi:hypothetical protein
MSNSALAALLREQAKDRREREDEKSSMFGFLRGLDPSFDDRSKPGLGIDSDDPLYNIANIIRGMSGVQTGGEKRAAEEHLGKMEQKKAWSMIRNLPENPNTQQRLKVRGEIIDLFPNAEKPIEFLDKWITQSYEGGYRDFLEDNFMNDDGYSLKDVRNALIFARINYSKQSLDSLEKLVKDREEKVASSLMTKMPPSSVLDMEKMLFEFGKNNLLGTPTGKRLTERADQKSRENAERRKEVRKEQQDFIRTFDMRLGEVNKMAIGLQVDLAEAGIFLPTNHDQTRKEREARITSALNNSFYFIKDAMRKSVGDASTFDKLYSGGPITGWRAVPGKLLNLQARINGKMEGVFWEGDKINEDMLIPMVQALVGTLDVPYFNLSQHRQEYTNGEMESLEARDKRVSDAHKMLNLLANAGLLSENVKIVDREGSNVIWSPKWNDERGQARSKQMGGS